jgi:hypothetical protein
VSERRRVSPKRSVRKKEGFAEAECRSLLTSLRSANPLEPVTLRSANPLHLVTLRF